MTTQLVGTLALVGFLFVIVPLLVYADGRRIGIENAERYALYTVITGGVAATLYLFEREQRTYGTTASTGNATTTSDSEMEHSSTVDVDEEPGR